MPSQQPNVTVFVVDDEAPIRQAMLMLFRSVGITAETFASGDEFLASVDLSRAGCLVLDIRMPGLGGMDLQEQLIGRGCRLPIIFVTGHADVPMAVEAMQKGAFDFIQKPFRDQDLLERVNAALERDRHIRDEGERQADIASRIATLTNREREVLELVVTGKPNKVIAWELGTSQRTVEIHRARVMDKMAADSLADLVRMCLLLPPETHD